MLEHQIGRELAMIFRNVAGDPRDVTLNSELQTQRILCLRIRTSAIDYMHVVVLVENNVALFWKRSRCPSFLPRVL